MINDEMTVTELINILRTYDGKYLVQLDFDSTNLNIRNTDYRGESLDKAIDTIFLPTEYEYRK